MSGTKTRRERAFQDMATAPRDGSTIEVPPGAAPGNITSGMGGTEPSVRSGERSALQDAAQNHGMAANLMGAMTRKDVLSAKHDEAMRVAKSARRVAEEAVRDAIEAEIDECEAYMAFLQAAGAERSIIARAQKRQLVLMVSNKPYAAGYVKRALTTSGFLKAWFGL